MIKVKLQEILDREERSLNWVAVKTGIAYSTLHKLNSNNTTSISFKTIDKLCELFKCNTIDIIEYTKDNWNKIRYKKYNNGQGVFLILSIVIFF